MTPSRRRRLGLLAVLLAIAVVYAVRLGEAGWGSGPFPTYLYDEGYTAFHAGRMLARDPAIHTPNARRFEYLERGRDDLSPTSRAEWSHPPGAPLAVAATVAAFGFDAVGARLAPLLAALATLAAVGSLARPRAAPFACVLLAADGVFFVFARAALPYMFVTAAVAVGSACLMRALVRRGRARAAWLVGAGVALGFGVAVRWTALPVALAVLLAVAVSRAGRRRRVGLSLLGVLGVAGVTYALTFVPLLVAGATPSELVALHREMLWFHRHLPASSGQSTAWYTWATSLRSTLFRAVPRGDTAAIVVAAKNPLVWLAILPSLALAAWRARRGSVRELLAIAVVVSVYGPWVILQRFSLSYYLLPLLPFVALTVTSALARRRWILRGYVAAAIAAFALLYPALSNLPVSRATEATYLAVLVRR
jgi:4-amino-4-deoxy-L-arabinose transferase-like glycosyltransferase